MRKNKFIEVEKDELKAYLESELPPIISRSKISEYTGGYYSPGTLANEDSRGTGPKNPICGEGGKIAYMKPYLIEWILSKSKVKQLIND